MKGKLRSQPTVKNQKSFESLTIEHLDRLYSNALRLTRNSNDAEDLVQETYLRAFRFWKSFKKDTSVKAWLFKIQTNVFLTNYKKKKRQREILQDAQSEQKALDGVLYQKSSLNHASPEKVFQENHLSKPVEEALHNMSDDFRLVVILCDIQGFSYKETAESIGCPVGTVMSRLYRGRKQLKKLIEETKDATEILNLNDYRESKGHAS